MELFPAIDILSGSAVRLLHGDYAQKTVYYPDAFDAAEHLAAQGAKKLHVVDLDGARSGRTDNFAAIGRIAALPACLCRWAAASAALRASKPAWTRAWTA